MSEQYRVVDDNGHGYMSPDLRRLFLSFDCDPACHACKRKIEDGELFAMVRGKPKYNWDDNAYSTETETMVCWDCRDVDIVQLRKDEDEAYRKRYKAMHGKYPGCHILGGRLTATLPKGMRL